MEPDKIIKILKHLVPFLIACAVLAMLAAALFFHSVHETVVKTSRCKRMNDKFAGGMVYKVTARSPEKGIPLYTVDYNLSSRQSNHACMCPKGEVLNEFKFKLRDLNNNKNMDGILNCPCDDNYVALLQNEYSNKPAYEGYPELVNYMYTDGVDDSFFRMPSNYVIAA